MIPNDDKISSLELGAFLFLSIIGIGALSLPSQLVMSVNNDAWILAILIGLLCIVFLYIICKVGVKYSSYGFVGTLRTLFGGFIGTILAVPVMIYAICMAAVQLRMFAELTKLYLLYKTPLEFIILPMVLLVIVLVRYGIEPISRTFQIFFPVVAVVLLALIIVNFQKADITNLRPFFSNPVSGYINGMGPSLIAYSGFAIIIVLFPFMRTPKKAFKASAITMGIITILYTIVAIQCISRLGVEETKSLIYPVMALTKSTSIPGGFIEGLEGLLSSLWVIFAFTILAAFLHLFSVVGADILGHRKQGHFASLSLPIIYLIALQENSIPEIFRFAENVAVYLGGYTIFVLPILMLIASTIRGSEKQKTDQ